MTLVDSNILIDLIVEDPIWLERSRTIFQNRSALGPMFIIDVVFSETSVRFSDAQECRAFLDAIGVTMIAMSDEALWLAGQAFRAYRRQGGVKTNVLPDFFIGAQAQASGLPILSRDARRYARYFPDVALITPEGT